jgi:Tfp pilus assembly protein PilN
MSGHELMFTIDLLNGRGLPHKTRPAGVVITAATSVLPVLLAMGTLGIYLNNNVLLSLKEHEVVKNKARMDHYAEALEQHEALVKEKIMYASCLSEVSASIKNYTQWSPILTTVVETMPESVVLTSLEVERDSIKKTVPTEDDPEKTKEIQVPIRVLRLNVSGGPDCDEAVRDFQDRLRTSVLLGPKLENIQVSRDSETFKGQDIFSYEITCDFKPGL